MVASASIRVVDFDPAIAVSDTDLVYGFQTNEVKMTVAQLRTALASNATRETFSLGSGFTAGATSITLAGTYGSVNNILVLFDANVQTDCTLTGQTLGFNPTVPVGVQQIVIIGGQARSIGVPATGSVTDLQVAPGAAINATKLSYAPTLTGSVVRPVSVKLGDLRTVQDFGALSDGSTDDSAAVTLAEAAGVALFTFGTTKTNTAQTATNQRWLALGTDFSGTHPIDANVSLFGPGVLRAGSTGAYNGIVASAYNNAPAGTAIFPSAITAYARVDNAGNDVFALFGRADMYASGTATSEINTFNFAGAPSIALPPDRSFGTAQINPITLTIAGAGTFPNSIGIHIAKEGSQPQPYLTGIYTNPDAVTSFGICIGASATQSPTTSACFQNSGAGTNLLLQTLGTAVPGNNMILCNNAAAVSVFSVKQNGQVAFTSAIVSTSATAGSASALPSAPANYLQIQIDGVVYKVPYYNS